MDSPRVYARNAHCTHTTHFIVFHFCVSAVVFFHHHCSHFFSFVLCFVFYISNVICSLFKWILWDTTRHLFTSTTATVLAKTWKSLALRHEYGFFVLLLFFLFFFCCIWFTQFVCDSIKYLKILSVFRFQEILTNFLQPVLRLVIAFYFNSSICFWLVHHLCFYLHCKELQRVW